MNKSLSLFSANLLFTLTMLLVITLGSILQSMNLSWGLIATEVFMIGLPTIVFLRNRRIPLREGLRFNSINPLTGVLCVALGIGLYLFGLLIEGVMAQVSGLKSAPIASDLLPKSSWEMVVYYVALAIFAPLGEEILFRGAVQTTYEKKKSARFAITITALMFAFYHLRLTGLPALLPVAFVLSFVVWRTQSIYAGMLIHFGNNSASALQSITYFTTGKSLPFISLWSGVLGLLFAIVILFVITRLHPLPPKEETGNALDPGSATPKPWLATYWPLLIAGFLYLGIAGMTAAASLNRVLAPSTEVSYGIPALLSTVESQYEITNKGGQAVGLLDCKLTSNGVAVHLTCTRTIRSYELSSGNSYYKDENHTDSMKFGWNFKTMELESFSSEWKYENGRVFRAELEDGQLVVTDSSGTQTAAVGKNALMEFEWAWHAALLKANSGQSFSILYGSLMTWDSNQNKSGPVVKNEILRVYGDETLSLPQGDLTVRKLTLAGCAAWYAKNDAIAGLPRPVKFDDGMVVYTLTSSVPQAGN